LRAQRVALAVVRVLVHAFFRRVEVVGLEHVPSDRGGVVVSWHPNGMVDPALLLARFPRRLVFGARHGLFRWPLLGRLMRALGTVPVYRAADVARGSDAERARANERSLDALAREVASDSFAALFPEGVSHDAPHPVALKSGAARLFYRAAELAGREPVILPVGLHYDDKELFRSSALVAFHPPLALPAGLAAEGGAETGHARAEALTLEIERVLCDVVLATESWALHALMHRARKLIRAERACRAGADPGPAGIAERVLGFARVRTGYYARLETHPSEVRALVARVAEYDADLLALGVEDHELDRPGSLYSPWLAILLGVQAVGIYLLAPPLLVVGYLVNLPAALVLVVASRLAARARKDEATIKVLLGALFFPASWVTAGVLASRAHAALHDAFPAIPDRPILAGVLVALLAAVGGAAAVRYLRVARETARALRVRLTRRLRRRALERLRRERTALHDALLALAEGIDLPGTALADGRIVERGVRIEPSDIE
jgi:1-acyl-sn-glycerol-3-phosphate acyltransferase